MDLYDFQISIIGAGNVATHLAEAFQKKGFRINEIYSRTRIRANELQSKIAGSSSAANLDFSSSKSKIFIVAVKDDAKHTIASNIKTPISSFVFHTSGTVDMEVLAMTGRSHGVFYPLQTFVFEGNLDFKKIPLLIEGSNNDALAVLYQLGRALSDNVQEVKGDARKKLHLAAVFASNFTNRMLAAAEEVLSSAQLDLNMLQPLVEQSMRNVFTHGADQALTGPAKRSDQKTINSHLAILENSPYMQSVYQQISDEIALKSGNGSSQESKS
jgi:predicted short-subunit dehydrogenase-like oxidoreductase (DUF2520 family)